MDLIDSNQGGASTPLQFLTSRDFDVASVQATLFTTPEGFSVSKVLSDFFTRVSSLLDADPVTLPGDSLPPSIPRVILGSRSGSWRCQISPARIDVFWNKADSAADDLSKLIEKTAEMALCYAERVGTQTLRLACVVNRYAPHESPSLMLARHFCKTGLDKAPLDRPSSFELHAHKEYTLNGFKVNSWVRSRSGAMVTDGKRQAIVMVEQDLNTPEGLNTLFDSEKIRSFFKICSSELNSILSLYYPE